MDVRNQNDLICFNQSKCQWIIHLESWQKARRNLFGISCKLQFQSSTYELKLLVLKLLSKCKKELFYWEIENDLLILSSPKDPITESCGNTGWSLKTSTRHWVLMSSTSSTSIGWCQFLFVYFCQLHSSSFCDCKVLWL